jgi:hypothetical protein
MHGIENVKYTTRSVHGWVCFHSQPQLALHGKFWKTCYNFSILNDLYATAAKFENSIKEKLRNGIWFKTNQNFTLYMEVNQAYNWIYVLERVPCDEVTLTFGTRKCYFRQNKWQVCHQNMQFLYKEGEESLIWWLPIPGLRKNSLNLCLFEWNIHLKFMVSNISPASGSHDWGFCGLLSLFRQVLCQYTFCFSQHSDHYDIFVCMLLVLELFQR